MQNGKMPPSFFFFLSLSCYLQGPGHSQLPSSIESSPPHPLHLRKQDLLFGLPPGLLHPSSVLLTVPPSGVSRRSQSGLPHTSLSCSAQHFHLCYLLQLSPVLSPPLSQNQTTSLLSPVIIPLILVDTLLSHVTADSDPNPLPLTHLHPALSIGVSVK